MTPKQHEIKNYRSVAGAIESVTSFLQLIPSHFLYQKNRKFCKLMSKQSSNIGYPILDEKFSIFICIFSILIINNHNKIYVHNKTDI